MVERADLERLCGVTSIAFANRLAESKLPCVNVAMAAGALARRTGIGGSVSAKAILFRGVVAAFAGGRRVRASQRPSTVVDAGGTPTAFRMALRAATCAHFFGELGAVGVVVAVRAGGGR